MIIISRYLLAIYDMIWKYQISIGDRVTDNNTNITVISRQHSQVQELLNFC